MMWIKNQQKDRIYNLNSIQVIIKHTDIDTEDNKTVERYFIIAKTIQDPRSQVLGKYKTKEIRDIAFERLEEAVALYGNTNYVFSLLEDY